MASKKGLSEAEKRTRMSEIFTSGEFYTFKEIEKIATQQKKIVPQSVKDVLQSLVDDKLVMSDKIGTSGYYWSFPSDAKRMRQLKIEELNKEVQALFGREQELEHLIAEASSVRQENDERNNLLKILEQQEALKVERQRELESFQDMDPRVLEREVRLLKLYKEASVRVIDNISNLQTYFVRELGLIQTDLEMQLGITEEILDETF